MDNRWPRHRSRFKSFRTLVACAIAFWTATAAAQTQTAPAVQIFVRIEGTTPDWQEMSLTVSRLQVTGQDVSGRHYAVTAFEGSRQLTIPRSAEGLARFLVAGETVPGRVDQLVLTITNASLAAQPTGTSTSPRVVPVVFTDNVLILQAPRPLSIMAGDTRSLLTPIRLGTDAVITRDGRIAVRPTVSALLLGTIRPENYLNGDEVLVNGPAATFPELGVTALRAKALDPDTAAVRDLIVHSGTGAQVSISELRARNEAIWKSRHGALDRQLVEHLETVESTDVVAADVWVNVPGPQTLLATAPSASELDVAHTAYLEERRAAAQPILDALQASIGEAGAMIGAVETSPPVIKIQASPSVLEDIARFENVLQVSRTQLGGDVLSTASAKDLLQERLQFAHALGFGTDLRIGIAEPEACIRTTHEAFRLVTFEEPVNPCGVNGLGARGGHSTAVAGALAAFVPPVPVPGPGRPVTGLVGLFGGRILTSDDCGIPGAMLSRNTHLVNLSCTNDLWHDGQEPYLDYAVFAHRVFVANGAGNVTPGDDPNAIVYCPAYNSVCVGGYNHVGTVGRDHWADDIPGNRWRNSPVTGREKPDLVGPTADLLPRFSADTAYETRGGTSFSTPFVVGTAGLLMANFPKLLLGNPTLTRAVLFASASHGFNGQKPVPLFSDGIDDRTGAGAPRGDRAFEILDDGQFFTGYLDRAVDFDSQGYLNVHIADFAASPGDKVRVALTYDQCQVNQLSLYDRMQADLDMTVFARGVARANNSHVDNTEIVEFTVAEQTGVSIRLRAQYWDACSDGSRRTYVAIAWDVLSPSEQ